MCSQLGMVSLGIKIYIKMDDVTPISVVSFNSRGFCAERQEFVKKLLLGCDVLFLQEHWLAPSQLSLLGNLNDNFVYTGISGFGNDDVLLGRPYGGCAILWRSDLNVQVHVLDVHSSRVCAVRLSNDTYRLLLMCVYMPYEGSELMTDEFASQLDIVDSILEANVDCHVIIGGDFNVDLSRLWVHSAMLKSFCDNAGLFPGDLHQNFNIDYSFILV